MAISSTPVSWLIKREGHPRKVFGRLEKGSESLDDQDELGGEGSVDGR
jgi:hypothetical protein